MSYLNPKNGSNDRYLENSEIKPILFINSHIYV